MPAVMRRLACLLALPVFIGASASAALAENPVVKTQSATGVTLDGATLAGTVKLSGAATYHFEWGTSTAYGQVAPSPDGPVPTGDFAHQLRQILTGLSTGTVYHYRLVVTDDHGQAIAGDDVTFTPQAPAAAGAPGDAAGPAGSVDDPAGTSGTDDGSPSPATVAKPALGSSVAGAPASGRILVRLPGQTAYTELQNGAALPVGTVVDATEGTFTLTSALDSSGHTQKATFWGGRFTVRQPAGGKGTVELKLVGTPAGCTKGVAKAAAKKKKPKAIRLWGQDNHGKFRTRGRFSAATVRGTKWLTTETCAGTRTTVAKGAVSVFDRVRHRTVLVRAGHSYLARRR
jgi:hypothetical protein